MPKEIRWVVVGLALILGGVGMAAPLLFQGGGEASGIDPADTAKLALGRQIYDAQCAVCHGAGLEGQPDWRQRRADGRLPAPPHDETGHTWHHPDAQLFALTKYGPAAIAGGSYQSDMPAYEGVLSDDEIWAVLSYIKSRWPPAVQARHDQITQASRQ
ncbi:c-type cytochrome [Pelagibius litoralis]|uniref:C-type cytochrome n=1 Tax=Pelagibius litoralis TaxID=374515 RepID=A0A967EV45_9PROT|nr:cytochrome c [Pelagibius litoralis]NIA67967.1 c-type cytochrome [Pelagibius litoralis]